MILKEEELPEDPRKSEAILKSNLDISPGAEYHALWEASDPPFLLELAGGARNSLKRSSKWLENDEIINEKLVKVDQIQLTKQQRRFSVVFHSFSEEQLAEARVSPLALSLLAGTERASAAW